MIRVTAVSYLNTKPMLYGLLHSPLAQQIEWQLDVPKGCAERLMDGRADIGLVPVAVFPSLPEGKIIGNFCIGADEIVETVCIFSAVPITAIETLYLDFESRTSVQLVQVLLRDFWHLSPRLLPAFPGYEKTLSGSTAGLVIGDKAIGLEYPYVYDLATAWKTHTALPFVFAAWMTNGYVPSETFLEQFNAALAFGVAQIPIISLLMPSPIPGYDTQRYFEKCISYPFDAAKKEAMQLFLSLIRH